MARRARRQETVPRNIKWPPELWAEIQRCAAMIAERESIDLRPAEFVRRAVRKEVAAMAETGQPMAAA